MTSVRSFKIEKKLVNGLTKDEKKVLPLLIEAVKKVDKIFILQENDEYNGANFYPHDATKAEIEEVAKENPKIFSPFTVVKRDLKGKLIAVDYHIEYLSLIKPIAQLLNKASRISNNKSFKYYLEVLSKSLSEGSYHEADIAWLTVKGSNLDLILGPHERYLDKLFFLKRAYQGSVAIIDKELTNKSRIIRDILYNTIGQRPDRIVLPSIVDVSVVHCPVYSGFLGKALFTRQHLPSDAEITERYGSRITGFICAINLKFEKLIFPIFNAIFEKSFKASYSKELLRQSNYYYVLLSAIAQQLHRYRGSRQRLKELFPVFDEANCVVSGIQHAKHLLLKGVIDQKELEGIMINQICWIFSEWISFKKSSIREDYLRGDALTLNFLIGQSALQEKEGVSWPNFAKMFFEIENLSSIFTRFLEEASYLEAQKFLSRYLSLEPFKSFDKRLATVKPL